MLRFPPFALRRIHSLSGLWFLLFLIEHLFTNSQAALWVGESGQGFIEAVNFIHNLPYLTLIEILLLGIPILTHVILGVQYALEAKSNDRRGDGTKPAMPEYARNRAYSWQRITSYFLLVMLIFHVAQFRFYAYPRSVSLGSTHHYLVRVFFDPGLYTVSSRLGVSLYDDKGRSSLLENLSTESEAHQLALAKAHFEKEGFNTKAASIAAEAQYKSYELSYRTLLEGFDLQEPGALIADCSDFGTATLLSVRDAFKNTWYGALYSLFVIAAVFHGCNGLWTFCITWGLLLKKSAQKAGSTVSVMLMLMLGFLGLAAIWGSYFVTLKS